MGIVINDENFVVGIDDLRNGCGYGKFFVIKLTSSFTISTSLKAFVSFCHCTL